MANGCPPQRRESGIHSRRTKLRIAAFILIFPIFLCFPGSVFAGNPDQGISIKFSHNLKETLVRAKVSRKPVVVAVFALWCPYCREMRETTMRAPEVVEAGEAFEWVFVDLEAVT